MPKYSELQAYTYLDKNGDFYQSPDGMTIKVYCDGNPNISGYPSDFNKPTYGTDDRAIQELWIAIDTAFLNRPHDCEIRDLELLGFGRFAFESVGSNVLIDHVKIDLIGGSVSNPTDVNSRNFNRFGNAVAVATSAESPVNNVEVRNCCISRTFDFAFTLNGFFSSYVKYGAENVIVENNTFENCPGISGSLYYRNSSGWVHGTTLARNCRFSYNKVFSTSNVFNSIKINDFAIGSGIPGFKISKNVFYDCDYMLRFSQKFGFDIDYGNVSYIHQKQQLFWDLSDTGFRIVEFSDNSTDGSGESAINEYREVSHDYQTQFISVNERIYSQINIPTMNIQNLN